MLSEKQILFFTNSEYGQASVMLAVAQEFLFHGEFSVHIASFAQLHSRVERIDKAAGRLMKCARCVLNSDYSSSKARNLKQHFTQFRVLP